MVFNVVAHSCVFNLNYNVIPSKKGIKKIRYININTNHLYLRIDENDSVERIDINTFNIEKYDAVLISDYCKGFLSKEDIVHISKLNPNCFLDTKKKIGDWCKNIKYIKLNEYEYNNNITFINQNKWIKEKIIKTLGENGAEYNNKIFPTHKIKNVDISGAGDAFFTAFSNAIINEHSIDTSIHIANQYTHNYLIHKKEYNEKDKQRLGV